MRPEQKRRVAQMAADDDLRAFFDLKERECVRGMTRATASQDEVMACRDRLLTLRALRNQMATITQGLEN